MICEKCHAYMNSLTIGMLSSLLQTVLTKFHKIREYVMCCVSFFAMFIYTTTLHDKKSRQQKTLPTVIYKYKLDC